MIQRSSWAALAMKGAALLMLVLGLGACTATKPVASSPSPYQPETVARDGHSVGCSQLMETFCDALFAPNAGGNLRIAGSDAYSIQRGTTENDIRRTFSLFSEAKLNGRHRLPKDLVAALERQDYFTLLRSFLDRPSLARMTLEQRAEDIRLQNRIDAIWRSAIEETLLKRMRKLFPRHHQTRDDLMPLAEKWERAKQGTRLANEIAIALWKDHPNWKRAEAGFTRIRAALLEQIDEVEVSKATKERWRDRLMKVRLVIPGSLPEITDSTCAATENNAYYYPLLNVLTVCAGDFNVSDIYQTLAHELAHSIDVESTSLSFRMDSRLHKEIASLLPLSCSNAPPNCEAYASLKSRLDELISDWTSYTVDLPRFQSCLQRRPPAKELTEEAITRAAFDTVAEAASELAESHEFLRLTKPKLPYPDGTWRRNPSYLDACAQEEVSGTPDPFAAETMLRRFFVASYRCEQGSDSERLRKAIAEARWLSQRITAAELKMTGPYSGNPSLVTSGHASPPDERFADVMGSRALATVLKSLPDVWNRRKLFLATSAWQCTRPSLTKIFPEEAQVENENSLDSHATGRERRLESLSPSIRDALQCDKDFEFKECRLEDLK